MTGHRDDSAGAPGHERLLTAGHDLIVVGLGFGDEGKGATVDWLCAQGGVAAVVRFNGGAQAAHNVTAEGRHHTFRQFGSGTLAGVPTYLAGTMLVEPISLADEAERLAALGVDNPLSAVTVHPDALLTTPVHAAANRTREDARGAVRHGSCGLGIGETTWYDLATKAGVRAGDTLENFAAPSDVTDSAIRVRDCLDVRTLTRKLDALAAFYRPLLDTGRHGHPAVEDLVQVYSEFAAAVRIADEHHLAAVAGGGRLVYEGAQGVLLDELRGLHPYTTWTRTTPTHARAIGRAIGRPTATLGVLRTYQTRHGAGPLAGEDHELRAARPERHNATGVYQGQWRVGPLDPVALRYAAAACGRVDGLALTHLDTIDGARYIRGYEYAGHRVDRLPQGPDLHHQQRLTRVVQHSAVALADLPAEPGELTAAVADLMGAPVVLTADGPDRKNRSVV
jgi:adenylosuccinate synthase